MCIRDSPLRITVWSDPRTNSSLHTVLELDQSACPESRRSGLSDVSGCTHPTELASIFHATVDLPVADLGPAWGLHRRARRRTKTRRSGRVRVSCLLVVGAGPVCSGGPGCRSEPVESSRQ